ncbi:MAG: hypothetical protein IPJ13_20505 [Saprospiraceae bacterium]|nr:hypothetical protein [Saprospiraceae bacterium]
MLENKFCSLRVWPETNRQKLCMFLLERLNIGDMPPKNQKSESAVKTESGDSPRTGKWSEQILADERLPLHWMISICTSALVPTGRAAVAVGSAPIVVTHDTRLEDKIGQE